VQGHANLKAFLSKLLVSIQKQANIYESNCQQLRAIQRVLGELSKNSEELKEVILVKEKKMAPFNQNYCKYSYMQPSPQ